MAGDDSKDRAKVASADALHARLGDRVREARTAAGLTPTDAARAAGLTTTALWRLENARQSASVLTLARVAAALGTTMSDLLAGLSVDPSSLDARPFAWKGGSDPRPAGWNKSGDAVGRPSDPGEQEDNGQEENIAPSKRKGSTLGQGAK